MREKVIVLFLTMTFARQSHTWYVIIIFITIILYYPLFQQFAQNFAHHFRVSLALCCLHRLSHKEGNDFLIAGEVVGDNLRVSVDYAFHHRFSISASCEGETRTFTSSAPGALPSLITSPMMKLAAFLGAAPTATVPSKRSAIATSAVRSAAS